jgi:hypothetical protein
MRKISWFPILLSIAFIIHSCDDGVETPTLAIGDFHEGGVVFYIDKTGEHGLVCSVVSSLTKVEWGCPDLVSFGAKDTEIGTGAQNTMDILNACNEENIAAVLCDEFESNGYSDWYLPSKDELDSLYQHREIVSEISLQNNGGPLWDEEYWSSSHQLDNTVWIQNFNAGNKSGALKDKKYHFRAIRSF